jgi:pyruvate kinase
MVERERRKTKIVCTIGPASESPQIIEALIRGGMNIARLNFSHGTHEEHLTKIKTIRQIAERLKQPVSILQDLAGPKIRIGRIKNGGVELTRGGRFSLTNREIMGDEKGASVTYPSLPNEVKPGDRILLADGTIELRIKERWSRSPMRPGGADFLRASIFQPGPFCQGPDGKDHQDSFAFETEWIWSASPM